MVPRSEGENFFEALRGLGLDIIELNLCTEGKAPELGEGFSIHDAHALKARLDAKNVKVTALILGTDFSGPDAEEHVQWAIDSIRAAKVLGAPAVRIDTATQAQIPVEEVRANFVRCITRVLDETADTGVSLGIENHGHISNNPEYLDAIFAEVRNDRLGLTYDTGNFYWYGLPLSELYQVLEHFAPRARHTHMKSINYPKELRETRRETGLRYGELCCALDEGNIDFKRVVGFLKDAGYQGTLCIENESLPRYSVEEQKDIIRRDAALLRAVQA
jgi:sugar phosphate isomerase/epimerase